MRAITRRTISLFLVWHVIAITVESVPPPGETTERTRRTTTSRDPLATVVTPVLDSVYAGWSAARRAWWTVSSPLRAATGAYVRVTGLHQHWNMFSEPPSLDHYVLMRYHVRAGPGGPTTWIDRELVFPATLETGYRPVNPHYFEEKAVRNARQRFLAAVSRLGTITAVSDLPPDLSPLVRYFARRYRSRHLADREEVARAEIWLGSAPVPPPGGRATRHAGERPEVLRAYRDAPPSVLAGAVPARPLPLGTSRREADIDWTLVYVEEW